MVGTGQAKEKQVLLDFIVSDHNRHYPTVGRVALNEVGGCGGNNVLDGACDNRVATIFIFSENENVEWVYVAPRCALHSIHTEIRLQEAGVSYIRKVVR
jgi:hypothetical protein